MKPNLLIIYCDQLNSWGLSCYGGHIIDTPHIDRLAKEGARCNQFFTNAAVCVASRACFMTGRYPNQSGIYQSNGALGSDQLTFAQVLSEAGYHTGYAGKWHLAGRRNLNNNWQPKENFGWQDNRFMWNKGAFKSISDNNGIPTGCNKTIGDERSYSSDWLTTRTIDFIKEHNTSKPFAYMVSFPDPHQPYRAREPYASLFPESEVEIPSTFWQEDIPDWLVNLRENDYFPMQIENRGPWNMDRERAFREVKSNYCGMIKHIDDCVGRILQALETCGQLDNTMVVFTTDHGDLMGEHGLTQKEYLYETPYRIPLLVRWPDTIAANTIIDQMLCTVDFMPTLLSLLECPSAPQTEGRNAAGFFTQQEHDGSWENLVFAHPFTFNRVACFSPDYLLGYQESGQAVLFDRHKDPDQIHNLFGCPEHHALTESLTETMREHFSRHCPRALNWIGSPTSQ